MTTHAQLAHEAGTTSEQQVARVYAEALFNQAWKKNLAQETLDHLEGIVALLRQFPDFAGFLSNPGVSREARSQLIDKVLRGRVSDLVLDFLMVVNEHDRLGILRPITTAFRADYEFRLDRQRVQVRSAKPLEDAQLKRLTDEIRQIINREPVLDTRVDPDLLGGMVVQVGDWLYDASVRTQLLAIRNRLTERSSHEIQSGRDRFSS
jgi:F-type H+-transporting ATPase subunit delta